MATLDPTAFTLPTHHPENAQREDAIDALRGFALLGIAVVNLGAMSNTFFGTGWSDPAYSRPWDMAIQWWVRCLFEAKFYLLFSTLFGYSLALQQHSAQRAGVAFAPRWWRRSAGLALLGLAHGILFFPGDILLPYAVLGLLLWAVSRWQRSFLLHWAIGLLALSASGWLLLAGLVSADDPAQATSVLASAQHARQALHGTVPQVVEHNLQQLVEVVWPMIAWVQAPSALAMMVFGYHLAVTGALRPIAQGFKTWSPSRWKMWVLWGAGGALAYATLGQPPVTARGTLLALAVGVASAPALALLYAYGLWRALNGICGKHLSGWLAPAGRMALSLYLMQTIAGALLFTGWGAALEGSASPGQVVMLAGMLYAGQLVLARNWMARHQYGPVEWWLRAWTYGRWPVHASQPRDGDSRTPQRSQTQ